MRRVAPRVPRRETGSPAAFLRVISWRTLLSFARAAWRRSAAPDLPPFKAGPASFSSDLFAFESTRLVAAPSFSTGEVALEDGFFAAVDPRAVVGLRAVGVFAPVRVPALAVFFAPVDLRAVAGFFALAVFVAALDRAVAERFPAVAVFRGAAVVFPAEAAFLGAAVVFALVERREAPAFFVEAELPAVRAELLRRPAVLRFSALSVADARTRPVVALRRFDPFSFFLPAPAAMPFLLGSGARLKESFCPRSAVKVCCEIQACRESLPEKWVLGRGGDSAGVGETGSGEGVEAEIPFRLRQIRDARGVEG